MPLIELRTTHNVRFLTDNAGIIAFEPPLRVQFEYFTDAQGVPRGVARMPGSGPTWISGYVGLRDKNGTPKLMGTYLPMGGTQTAGFFDLRNRR